MELFRTWFDAWLSRRSPRSEKVRLTNRNIYIFPSKPGWLFIVIMFVLLLTGINYQNSLVFGICFWLGSVFAILIWHTWKNLAGLEVAVDDEVAGFVGERVAINQRVISADQSTHFNVQIHWRNDDIATSGFDIKPDQVVNTFLSYQVKHRGWNQTPRMEVLTRFPLGILTAWSVIQLNHSVLGYPEPTFGVSPKNLSEGDQELTDEAQTVVSSRQSGSDFDSLSPYVKGDSLKKVDWKRYAKTEELVTKTFVAPPSSNAWIRFEDFQGLPLEQRLSAMTGWVLEWTRQNRVFGLTLPDSNIPQSSGEQHQWACLRALALYGVDHSSGEKVIR